MNMMISPDGMGRKAAHNAQIRTRILDTAASVFCRFGFDGASVDMLMAEVGLTRGAFYAHFPSKDALFMTVIAERNGLLSALQRREDDDDADAMWHQMRGIIEDYLDPRADGMRRRCVLVNLTAPAAQHSPDAARAILRGTAAVQHQITRGQPIDPADPDITAALSVVMGAATRAMVCTDPATRAATLETAVCVFRRLTSGARQRGKLRADATA